MLGTSEKLKAGLETTKTRRQVRATFRRREPTLTRTPPMTICIRSAGTLSTGDKVSEIEISNELMSVRLIDLGATLWKLIPHKHPSSNGVCLFQPDPLSYADNPSYLGCTIGPLANRVTNSRFTLQGRTHKLTPNEGPNHLHGGPAGFGHRIWSFETDPATNSVVFTINRPDGEGGYPGNLDVDATWTLDENCLRFEWTAKADQPTPVSLTNHTYWNLAGRGTIEDHHLQLASSEIVEVDDQLLPTGELVPTQATPFDLSGNPRLGDAIQPFKPGGLDHCYAVTLGSPALLGDPESGLSLEVDTSLPGIQVYTGHHLDGSSEHGGYGPLSGVCLESQFFPDAVNQSHFASPVLSANQTARYWTTYTFHGIPPAERGPK